MVDRVNISEQVLPIAISVAGLTMTGLSVNLLIGSASLGVFMHKVLGFIGVISVNSAILSFVAIRTTISREYEATRGEKIFLVALSLCTGIGLAIAHVADL